MLMMEEDDTLDLEAHQVEIDPDFEPQSRPRSCTWPLPHPDDFPGGGEEENGVASSSSPSSSVKKEPGMPKDATGLGAELNGGAALEHNRSVGALSPAAAAVHASLCGAALDVAGHLRKTKSSRRNAWGNQSYADLITRAIESTPEKRLTLSQIYDWMVRYVPYFKDKGDSNSSAGWKNSIRHNLSLHTRFIRVQNEGTGKSSWWMLNPDGGKSGKAPRRRAVSMDNNSKFLKSKGRASKKKAAAVAASAQEGPEESPGRGAGGAWSPAGGGGVVAGGVGEEFDAWTDIRSRASSSASTLSSRLSPILAADDDLEPEDGPSCSASPRMYPSPCSTLSPNVGTGGRCPVELPQLADLTGAINLNENLNGLLEHRQDSYAPSHQQMKQRASGFPFHGSKCAGTPSSAGTYCGTIYSQSSMGMLRHSPMQTIQENKPTTFQAAVGSHYPSSTSLQDLLTSTQQYRAKALMLSHEVNSLMPNPAVGVTSHAHSHSHSHSHSHRPTLCSSSSGSISRGLSNGGGLMQAYNNTNNSLKVGGMYPSSNHSHLPTSTALPPNPAGLLGAPLDTCHLATAPHQRPHPGQPYPIHSHHQGMVDSIHGPYHPHPHPQGNYHYHSHLHHHYPPERLPADLDLDMFHGSLDCDVESIILNDFMDSSEEIDFNFDCTLSQGNMGMAMGMGNLPGTPQTHNNQSWVPG